MGTTRDALENVTKALMTAIQFEEFKALLDDLQDEEHEKGFDRGYDAGYDRGYDVGRESNECDRGHSDD